ncbi:YlxR family protein [Streptomyces sp. NRRL F-5135]|uniref:YlxR family protein n=1 Tax=Streptomyces sp. NRRL F-5135 TaxID=1463858 RepID=UPI0004C77574|nr:YlxR family protein [Streptomyces sp. NRRL F-5135]
MGCRKRTAKSDLLRIVVIEEHCVPDQRGTLPGRGAYLHPALICLDLAVRRRAFPRAFRVQGPLDSAEVRRVIEEVSERAAP